MFLIEKFFFIFTLETGGRIISWYCSLVNIFYCIVLMQMLNSFDVLKDPMSGFEKFQILCVASCVNFFIYYIFGSMVLTCGIIERNHRILKCFLYYHTAMTVSILFGGLFFSLQYSTPPHRDHQHHQKPEKQVMYVTESHDLTVVVESDKKEPNLPLLALTTIDFFIRSYMTLCVYSLYVIFHSEKPDSEYGSDKQRMSLGSGTAGSDKMTDNCSIINER